MANDEFDWIASLKPLAPSGEALNLADDAAVIPSRPGQDLIISKDTMVEGVHYPPGTSLDAVAGRLLRAAVSDLAAKGAEPYGWFLSVAWPNRLDADDRRAFRSGLKRTQAALGISLFGGDTVSTSGPLVASATVLGWVAKGRMVRRDGAKAGDFVLVSGTIGDGYLGLLEVQGELADLDPQHRLYLRERFLAPNPRLDLREALSMARSSADVSDGLMADTGHIAAASGVGMEIDLDTVPLSDAARAWLGAQPDQTQALIALVTGGDDYELVVTGTGVIPGFEVIGRVVEGQGVEARINLQSVAIDSAGWRHGKDG